MSGEPCDPKTLAAIERAVLAMPARRREIFLAIRLDSLSYQEIADRIGLSARKVEREFARALVQLAQLVDGDEQGPWRWLASV